MARGVQHDIAVMSVAGAAEAVEAVEVEVEL